MVTLNQQVIFFLNQRHSKVGKSRDKTLENLFFLYNFNNFSKNWGWRGELLHYIIELYKKVSRTLKYKLQAAAPAFCRYFLA